MWLWPTGNAVGPFPSEMRSFFTVLAAAMVLAQTVSAATAAAQANVDRFSSGDFAIGEGHLRSSHVCIT
jgi:Spy/CpxP family protein refolding chaperone